MKSTKGEFGYNGEGTMRLPKDKIFYTTDAIIGGFKSDPNKSYTVKIGFMPEKATYVALRDEDPVFLLTGNSLVGVKERARRALEFYTEYGLQEEKTIEETFERAE